MSERAKVRALTIHVAGHSHGNLICHSLHSVCGNINNGLGFKFSDGNRGSFVLNFNDFEKVYWAAKKLRGGEDGVPSDDK